MSETQMILTLIGSMVIGILNYIITAIAYWKIFTKAGEAGWKGIIPLLNSYTLFKISWNTVMFWTMLALEMIYFIMSRVLPDNSVMVFILCLIVLVLIGINAVHAEKLSNAFGHGMGYTVGLIFLPVIFMLILAFGNSQYVGKDNNQNQKL